MSFPWKRESRRTIFSPPLFLEKSGAKNRAVGSLRASCGSPSYFVLDLTLMGLGRPDKIDSGSPATANWANQNGSKRLIELNCLAGVAGKIQTTPLYSGVVLILKIFTSGLQAKTYNLFYHFIHQSVFYRFFRVHKVIAIGIPFHCLNVLTGMFGQDSV